MRLKRERVHPPAMSTNTSDSDQNISSETSTNGGRPLSELSLKTSASDPLGLMEDEAKSLALAAQHSSKATSYMDIHSDYTKRRYKHVESKVGQYIASIKADDQRRRSQARFQRHRSMPDTLTGVSFGAGAQTSQLTASAAQYSPKKMHGSNSDTEADSARNSNTIDSASTSTSSTSHESSGVTDINEKLSYEQLLHENDRIQSYSDYLQTRLDEKHGETMRLKRNVDFLRIELSSCQDKLRKKNMSASVNGLNKFNGTPTLSSSLGRHSLPSLVYCQANSTKSTQTDLLTPPLLRTRGFYITPDTPDSNNKTFSESSHKDMLPYATTSTNSLSAEDNRSAATMLFFFILSHLLRNTNSIDVSSDVLPARPNENRTGSHVRFGSSLEDAIDIEAMELDAKSPKQRNSVRRVLQPPRQTHQQSNGYKSEQQVPSCCCSSDCPCGKDENCNGSNKREHGNAKPPTLRRRWLRLLGPCVRRYDPNPNQTPNNNNGTQFPLLGKSGENICRNLR